MVATSASAASRRVKPMIGQEISHYRIVEKLGEGGMGAVYKAEDTVLKRFVALKFLSAEALGSEEERARFLREAQAAAALDHPSICTVYEVGEAEGRIFLSMAYLEGETLRRRVEQQPIPVGDAIRLLIEVLEGLHEAHDLAIVHRDIKSSNIMVTKRGRAKIMDFGLAQLPGAARITQLGTTLGTAAYMSPEQAEGLVVDHRTDLWSVGVVLYEALTGTLPFRGDYIPALMYAIVHEEPRPLFWLSSFEQLLVSKASFLHGLEERLQTDLGAIVSRALTKKPEQRFQNAAEMIGALGTVQEQHGFDKGSVSRSVVVAQPAEPAEGPQLPTPPQEPPPADKPSATAATRTVPSEPAAVTTSASRPGGNFGMFAAGVAVAALVLAAVWMWRILTPPAPPMTVDMEVGGVSAPAPKVEKVESPGGPAPAGAPTPPVAKIEAPFPVAAEEASPTPQPDEPRPEPAAPQGGVAPLPPATTPEAPQAAPEPNTLAASVADTKAASDQPPPDSDVSLAARQIAMRGYALLDDRTGESARSAMALFEEALDLDPRSALSHAGRALVYAAHALQGTLPPSVVLRRAEEASGKALAIDDSLVPAHIAAGVAQGLGHWNWDGAKASFDRTLALEPDNADAHLMYAMAYLIPRRQIADALISLRRAAALKPSAPDIGTQLGRVLSYAGQDDAAIKQYRATLRTRPNYSPAYWALGMAYARKGEYGAARKAFNRVLASKPGNAAGLAGLAYVDVLTGDTNRARKRNPRGRKGMVGRRGRPQGAGYVSPYWRVLVAVGMKKNSTAFRWLDEGVAQHDPFVAHAASQPELEGLRKDSRFSVLLRKMNLSP